MNQLSSREAITSGLTTNEEQKATSLNTCENESSLPNAEGAFTQQLTSAVIPLVKAIPMSIVIQPGDPLPQSPARQYPTTRLDWHVTVDGRRDTPLTPLRYTSIESFYSNPL
jgi:hypothetical protein